MSALIVLSLKVSLNLPLSWVLAWEAEVACSLNPDAYIITVSIHDHYLQGAIISSSHFHVASYLSSRRGDRTWMTLEKKVITLKNTVSQILCSDLMHLNLMTFYLLRTSFCMQKYDLLCVI